MTDRWLLDLLDVLNEVANERFEARTLKPSALKAQILRLSMAYNDRQATPAGEDLEARLLFFTPTDLCKVAYPVAELQKCGHLGKGALRVLDIGAGCGAQTLGLMRQLARAATPSTLAVTAVDTDDRALDLFAGIVRRYSQRSGPTSRIRLTPRRADLRNLAEIPEGPYDLILAGTVFAELPGKQHLTLGQALLDRLDPAGALLIIEPALRMTSRALHELRDALLQRKLAQVFAPCTRRQGGCPALLRADDWCHEARPWQPPQQLIPLVGATGLRKHLLKWSYLTLTKRPENVAGPRTNCARVVSDQLRSKGKREVFVCCENGRFRLSRLDRDRSERNQAIKQIYRGQLVQLQTAPTSKGTDSPQLLRVGRDDCLEVEDPTCLR